MSRQKKKGTAFETAVAEYLAGMLGVEVRRNPLMASLDQGDLYGVFHHGKHFVIECKDYSGKYELAQWLSELQREMECSDTDEGAVVFHRNGVGAKSMGEQGVFMSLETLCRILEDE